MIDLIIGLAVLILFGLFYAVRNMMEAREMYNVVLKSGQNGAMLFVRRRTLRLAQGFVVEFVIYTGMMGSLVLDPPWRAFMFGLCLLVAIAWKVLVIAIDRFMMMRRYG